MANETWQGIPAWFCTKLPTGREAGDWVHWLMVPLQVVALPSDLKNKVSGKVHWSALKALLSFTLQRQENASAVTA